MFIVLERKIKIFILLRLHISSKENIIYYVGLALRSHCFGREKFTHTNTIYIQRKNEEKKKKLGILKIISKSELPKTNKNKFISN